MLRVLIAMLLLAPTMGAVTPEFDEGVEHRLELQSASVSLHITRSGEGFAVSVSTKFSILNAGEDALESRLVLPLEIVPEEQRGAFKLTAADFELPEPELENDRWRWQITLKPAQSLKLSWGYTVSATRLPQDHPLVHRLVRVPFQYVQDYAELPESITVEVDYTGLPDELFGREGSSASSTIRADTEVNEHMPNVEYRFFDKTAAETERVLRERLDEFDDDHKNAENRSYTDTLVRLYDVLKIRDDHAAVAEICATLADLEVTSGRAITLCGPWAKWRRYVPWALCRFASLREGDGDAREAAEAAKAVMNERWPEYLKAREERRPYDHFDAAKHGNFWDYDWERTRKVYAAVLKFLGEDEQAESVKQAGDDS